MSDAPKWDGVPRDPERDGWHWLASRKGTPMAAEWWSAGKTWINVGCVDMVKDRKTYLGPCAAPPISALTSAAWQAGWAAGREAAAKWHRKNEKACRYYVDIGLNPRINGEEADWHGNAAEHIEALPVPPPPHGEVG